MGLLEDEGNRNDNNSRKNSLNVDSSYIATQQIDSQFSPGDFSEADEYDDVYLNNTVPVDDTYLLEDAFETQLMDLAGETQVVDLAGETQVLDDLDFMNDMPMEFLNEFRAENGVLSKSEGANKTKALCETQVLSQDDSVKTNGSDLVGSESTMDICTPKQGSAFRGFTSIRAASIRASGLAARARGANANLCTTSCEKSTLEEIEDRKNDQECFHSEYNEEIEEQRNSNKYRVGNAAVRKLFGEDKVSEVDQLEADINQTDDNLGMPEICLAGLSYVNSQEPGELSQAHALEVVDKFLDLNVMEDEELFSMKRVHKAEETKVVSGAKGSRDLAKKSIVKITDGKCGIYDWDDTLEDDGGGDFFLKKKELFFDKGCPKKRSLTEPRKPKCPDLKCFGNNGDEKGQKHTKSKPGDAVYSDSGLMLHNNIRAKRKSLNCEETVFRKNLVKDLDEELAENGTNEDVRCMTDIGPDTQMAAEAMETLCFELNLPDSNINGPNKVAYSTKRASKKSQLSNTTALVPQRSYLASVGVVTRQAKQVKGTKTGANDEHSLSIELPKKTRKRRYTVPLVAEQRGLADADVLGYHITESSDQISEKKRHLEDQLGFYVPVAHRTRKRTELNCPRAAADAGDAINGLTSPCVLGKKTAAKDKNAEMLTPEEVRKVGSTASKPSNGTYDGSSTASKINVLGNIQGNGPDKQYSVRSKRYRKNAASISLGPDRNHLSESSKRNDLASASINTRSGNILLNPTANDRSSKNNSAQRDSDRVNVKANLAAGACRSKQVDEKSDAETSAEGAEASGRIEASPREKCGNSLSTCVTPVTRTTPIKDLSPLCVGDEYKTQSSKRNLSRLSLITEINDLATGSPGLYGGTKGSRKRKDITDIRVLFSQHLDLDIVRQQKKILARLGGAVVSSMSDATHFVADEFVRTRNMLEAIALGKPVVTHLWLDCCGQASCLIDEKNYILRDARKEKEFGFSLPVSLSRACQQPLLQGQKVLVTPNTKPGKEILASLIKAVHGVAVERLGRSVLKDEKLSEDLLILSCEEDYDTCVPFLEKGGAVYSSELLLNGIVKQKLEYERHRLFYDCVKKTRSTTWVKNKNQYLPLTKCK